MVSFWKSNEIEWNYSKSKWSRFLLILPSLAQFKMAAKNREWAYYTLLHSNKQVQYNKAIPRPPSRQLMGNPAGLHQFEFNLA